VATAGANAETKSKPACLYAGTGSSGERQCAMVVVGPGGERQDLLRKRDMFGGTIGDLARQLTFECELTTLTCEVPTRASDECRQTEFSLESMSTWLRAK